MASNCSSNLTDCNNNVNEETGERVNILVVTFQLLIVVIILMGNALILIAIKQEKTLQKVTYYFLGNLAVADILFGLGMGLRITYSLFYAITVYPCLIFNFMVFISGASSLSGACILCLQSFISVKFMIVAKTKFTKKLAWILISGNWIFWIVYGMIGIFTANTDLTTKDCYISSAYYKTPFLVIISIIGVVLILAVMIFQLTTLLTIRSQMNQLKAKMESIHPSTMAIKVRRLKKTINTAWIISLVMVMIATCWGPFIVTLGLMRLCRVCSITSTVSSYFALPTILNSMGNVFIYAAKSAEFRYAFKRVLGMNNCCGTAIQPVTSADNTVT